MKNIIILFTTALGQTSEELIPEAFDISIDYVGEFIKEKDGFTIRTTCDCALDSKIQLCFY